MNEGRWILLHILDNGKKIAVNLNNVSDITESEDGAWIDFVSGDFTRVRESFDEIGAMIR